MAEGMAVPEVAEEIAKHKESSEEQGHHPGAPEAWERWISITEAVLLSVVALIAAWSGYSAAKWGTESSLSLAHASASRTKASLADIKATQIETLDSVTFNAAFTAYAATRSLHSPLFLLAERRMRPGYQRVFKDWLALHPLTNPKAPPGPAYMPQYVIPQQVQATALTHVAEAEFAKGENAANTSDKYVRLTVLLAAVLFLVGIGSRFPVRAARYVLVGVAAVLLVVSLVQLLALPGPPA
jgi:hypothetical protein